MFPSFPPGNRWEPQGLWLSPTVSPHRTDPTPRNPRDRTRGLGWKTPMELHTFQEISNRTH